MMDAKENLLRAIHYDNPAYVPRSDEALFAGLQLKGNFQHGNWVDAWGVRWEATLAQFVPFPKGNPLPSLDLLDAYRLPDPAALLADDEVLAPLRRSDRGRFFVTGNLTYLLFERAWALMGMDNFMLALRTHRAEMHALLDAIADYDVQVFDRYLELGVDAISFSEDLGSQRALLISPQDLRTFFVPRYRRIFAHAVQAGVVVRFHSCGCVQAIAQDLAQAGATVLNPVQARANDLERLKADASSVGLALEGGIDSHLLTLGSPAEVRAETLRVLRLLAPGGGYIAGPDQAMPWPQANYDAMMATVQAYGRYPLALPAA
ncbi:MAG: uroporphyrinogen decarboxylase family protein [Anaerolineae bacterium]|jgi:uroporphyrinogen decarboxylase